MCILGLGYVGLPLACELAKYFEVYGFDVSEEKVQALCNLEDTQHILEGETARLKRIKFSTQINEFADATVFLICVPTPIRSDNTPDLRMIEAASHDISRVIKKNDLVINESTVYPGVTENICADIIFKNTGLRASVDYDLGYSPERINPGDKKNRLDNTTKVVSGGTASALRRIEEIYKLVTNDNIFKARSIKVAEAAKALENIQRDVNIALINEASKIFKKLEISTYDVLDAAGTKWNFHRYTPGLVGGHCISVDPYYLLHCFNEMGSSSLIIDAARNINESMVDHVASLVVQSALKKNGELKGSILIYGLSFKENVGDFRNSKSVALAGRLENMGMSVLVHDPYIENIDPNAGIAVGGPLDLTVPYKGEVAAVVVAVGHKEYQSLGARYFSELGEQTHPVLDLMNIFPDEQDFISL